MFLVSLFMIFLSIFLGCGAVKGLVTHHWPYFCFSSFHLIIEFVREDFEVQVFNKNVSVRCNVIET